MSTLRPRLLAVLGATLALAACAPDPTPVPEAASPAPAPTTVGDSGARGPVPVTLIIGDRRYAATLSDNPTARDLLTLVPLTLSFRDYNRVEKIAPLPRRLTVDGVPAGADPEVGDLGYYAPDGVLVLYYGEVGYFPGIVRLGTLAPDALPDIVLLPDGASVTITRA